MSYLDLQLVKKHLNVELDYKDDDDYIQSLVEVAEEKVAKELCITVSELASIDGAATHTGTVETGCPFIGRRILC